ncbi:MAG: DUF1499 domain-containing protein [Gammaproteobacteria bacterium]|nr:DUF1499 domain-containing protein [Gammaproteobacteria bacterium]
MRTWVRILLYSAITCLVLAIGGAWLHKFGVTSFGVSSMLVLVGFALSVLVALVTVGTLFVSVLRKQPYGLFTMFVAFVICFCLAGYAAILHNKSTTHPVAHNISTDLVDPPVFSQAVVALRGEMSNPVELDERKKELHKGAYDDIQSLVLNSSKDSVYSAALALVQESGWEIVTQNEQEGTIEATATTFWFGYKDDVVVRVRENVEGDSATVDLHSVSRIGQTDLGKNAERIRAFLADLAEKLGEQ